MFALLKGAAGRLPVGLLLLELVIVFVGVYLAFVLTEYQEDRQRERRTERIVQVLDLGLQRYEQVFGAMVQYHDRENAALRELLEAGGLPDFGDVYYPAPQYPMDVIDYIVTEEAFRVFDVDYYVGLIGFTNAVQRLMYIEEKLVGVAARYQPLPPADDPDHARVAREQRQLAQRYLGYMERRRNTAEELRTLSAGLLKQLEPRKPRGH